MKKVVFTLVILLSVLTVKAQEEGSTLDFTVGADLVSSSVWRGGYLGAASIQPSMGLEVAGFSVSAWGSVPFDGVGKEFDLTVGYEIAGLSIAITDYWWEGEGVYKYFMYDAHQTAHHFEATLGYTLPVESFPLSLSWSTMFAGADYKENGDRAYTTYIEATYPFAVKDIALEAAVGLNPWKSMAVGYYDFADACGVTNVSLKASKAIKITDSYSLPVFGQVIANPRAEDVFFVLGISL